MDYRSSSQWCRCSISTKCSRRQVPLLRMIKDRRDMNAHRLCSRLLTVSKTPMWWRLNRLSNCEYHRCSRCNHPWARAYQIFSLSHHECSPSSVLVGYRPHHRWACYPILHRISSWRTDLIPMTIAWSRISSSRWPSSLQQSSSARSLESPSLRTTLAFLTRIRKGRASQKIRWRSPPISTRMARSSLIWAERQPTLSDVYFKFILNFQKAFAVKT